MTATNPKLDRIAAVIRALKAKTTENGCTEEEAASAAAMVAAMLAKHNLTESEVELRENRFSRHRERTEDTVGDRLWKIADGVAYLVGCKSWKEGDGRAINFFGFDHEVEVARYLFAVCAHAMRSERDRLHHANAILSASRRRMIIVPFLDGMADSLRRRLKAMKPPVPTGKGLVVLRGELIERAFADTGIKLDTVSARRGRDFEPSYRKGVAAGERVALNPGLAGKADLLRLGRR